jgi:hypothetical protein
VLVLSRQAAHENAPDRGEYREVAGVVTAQDVMHSDAILPADKRSAPLPPSTQSRFCLTAPVAGPTFSSDFGAALQPTIQVASYLSCKRSARNSVPYVV